MAKKILIVDDEPEMVEILRIRLEDEGCDVVTAMTGEDGLKKAEIEHPDLILLDILLPGVSGFEVSRRLKNNELTKDIPIIMVTALKGEDPKRKGIQLGADYFVSKPFDSDELLTEIWSVLNKPT
jgi:DNA-binding response OmpR family regulator